MPALCGIPHKCTILRREITHAHLLVGAGASKIIDIFQLDKGGILFRLAAPFPDIKLSFKRDEEHVEEIREHLARCQERPS
ncbi:hypothetical protein [Brevundimonas sp.]|uniref:hypothetical protein n=1 Tax=Brevundimonas sp. TaxID=1871086 RepID=UPI00289EF598|nr:hypothetical protein [Brevundimonas sp.]